VKLIPRRVGRVVGPKRAKRLPIARKPPAADDPLGTAYRYNGEKPDMKVVQHGRHWKEGRRESGAEGA
jgi:hypothetical protein